MLTVIRDSSARHLKKIHELYDQDLEQGEFGEIRKTLVARDPLVPMVEQLEGLKSQADEQLAQIPAKLKPAKRKDISFDKLIRCLIQIYEKYTGPNASTLSVADDPDGGNGELSPTQFQELAKSCFIALGVKVIPSFYDKVVPAVCLRIEPTSQCRQVVALARLQEQNGYSQSPPSCRDNSRGQKAPSPHGRSCGEHRQSRGRPSRMMARTMCGTVKAASPINTAFCMDAIISFAGPNASIAARAISKEATV